MGSRNPERDWPVIGDATRLRELMRPGWAVFATCRQCWRLSRLNVPKVQRICGENATIGEVRPRLRCHDCGTRAPTLGATFVGRRERR